MVVCMVIVIVKIPLLLVLGKNVKLCHGEMDRNEPSSEESGTEEVLEAQQAIDDLIETESVVVVLPEEKMYDYYLVKLRSACKK